MADEKFDLQVGSGAYEIKAGSYKREGEEDTRYKFQIKFDLPTFTPELTEKLVRLGIHRAISVKAAGIFNKNNEYGTEADAEAFAATFGSVEGWESVFAKAVREKGERISGITPLVQCARDIYEVNYLKRLKNNGEITDAMNPPKAVLKEVRAKARQAQKDNSAGWIMCMEAAPKELEKRMKAADKAGDMPD